ncbi:MAG: MmcQ/YjbR family DNA-binding protein [Roseburia sp.]|nr:MmcQ/YjbR family DNA-binding protein [Anaeroplasma bactoclasticum]MCM1195578.1 MmcQ/YjbR family DNA-binding protein [Roseburia sp.]
MSIESEVFKKMKFNKDKLLAYGFEERQNCYRYSINMSNGFTAMIMLDESNQIAGKIIDLSLGEEYNNFRIESMKGEFVNSVREEYKNILLDIKNKCCERLYFITPQANRIAGKIIKQYHNQPEFLWESSPDYAIFRHINNKKWYALIAYIERRKLDKKAIGMVEILNLKIKEDERDALLKQEGFYLAWHMNKKSWVTITLDDTVSDEEVMMYIKKSYIYTS